MHRKAMAEINDALSACLLEPVIQKLASTGELDSFAEKIKSRKADPYTVAEEIAKNYFIRQDKK
jgi:LAO/AO transport system kinase